MSAPAQPESSRPEPARPLQPGHDRPDGTLPRPGTDVVARTVDLVTSTASTPHRGGATTP